MLEFTQQTPSSSPDVRQARPKVPKSYRVETYGDQGRWLEVFEYVRLDAAIKCEGRSWGGALPRESARIVRIRDGKVRTAEGNWK